MGVTIDRNNGTIGGTPTETGEFTVTVTATDTEGNAANRSFTITVCSPIVIAEIHDVTVTVGDAMPSRTASVTGGCGTITYTMSGAPSGVTIDRNNGSITGTPTETGEFTVTVTATDTEGNTDDELFRVMVPPPCEVTIAPIPDVTVTIGNSISLQASATGECGTITYTMSGAPSGVTIDRNNGSITGTPTETGEFTVTVTATDTEGNTDDELFRVMVPPPCEVTIAPIPDVTVTIGNSISLQASATGECGPITYTMSGAPSGVTIDRNNGSITGTPTETGEFTVTVTATDTEENTDDESFTITVVCREIEIADIPDRTVTVGQELDIDASASGGCPPITYTMTGAPEDITINTDTGQISGTVNDEPGPYTVTVRATDTEENTDDESFTITVIEPLTIEHLTDLLEEVDVPMTVIPVRVSGGRPPYGYSLSGAPSGIDISSTTGEISGTPTEIGTFTATMTVTDSDHRTASDDFTITIYTPGDFNGDGRVNAADSALFKKKMGLRSSDSGFDRRMDLNRDGIINFADFVIFGQYLEDDATELQEESQ